MRASLCCARAGDALRIKPKMSVLRRFIVSVAPGAPKRCGWGVTGQRPLGQRLPADCGEIEGASTPLTSESARAFWTPGLALAITISGVVLFPMGRRVNFTLRGVLMNRMMLMLFLVPSLALAGANEDFAAGVAAYKAKNYAEAEKKLRLARSFFSASA